MKTLPGNRFYEISALAAVAAFLLYITTAFGPVLRLDFEDWPPGAFLSALLLLLVVVAVAHTALKLNFPGWYPQEELSRFDTKASLALTIRLHDGGLVLAAVILLALNPGGYGFGPGLPGLSWDLGALATGAVLLSLVVWREVLVGRKAVIAPEDWGE